LATEEVPFLLCLKVFIFFGQWSVVLLGKNDLEGCLFLFYPIKSVLYFQEIPREPFIPLTPEEEAEVKRAFLPNNRYI
jgi:hypothetical protein